MSAEKNPRNHQIPERVGARKSVGEIVSSNLGNYIPKLRVYRPVWRAKRWSDLHVVSQRFSGLAEWQAPLPRAEFFTGVLSLPPLSPALASS